jgi:tetratricopeptide (TPR) repeat protein
MALLRLPRLNLDSRSYRPALWLLAALVLAGMLLGGWYLMRHGSTSNLRRLADEALRLNHPADAERYAAVLQSRGRDQEAQLIRGGVCVHTGRQLLQRRAMLNRCDEAEALVRTGLAAVPCLINPTGPIGLAGIHDPLTWRPVMAAQDRGAERRTLADRAEAALRQAYRELRSISEGSDYDEATLLLAEALTSVGTLGRPVPLYEITARLRALTARQPDHLEAHRRLAQIYIDLQAMAPAVLELREVARLDPEDGRPARFMALILRVSLNEGAALEAYEEALRRRLDAHVAVEVREELAELLVEQGFPQRAVDVLASAPAALRESPAGRTVEAAALWSLNRREEARQLVDFALKEDPGLASAIRLRAQMYLTEERPQEARALLEGLLKKDPFDEKALHLAIDACKLTGDAETAAAHRQVFDQTVARLRDATQLGRTAYTQPWDADTRLRAGKTWLELGRQQVARSWLRAALAADPTSAEARRLLAQLDP